MSLKLKKAQLNTAPSDAPNMPIKIENDKRKNSVWKHMRCDESILR